MQDKMNDNLYDLGIASNETRDKLKKFWRTCAFRKLLIENLQSPKHILDPPSEEFPRLRSYRGEGPHVELSYMICYSLKPVTGLMLSVHYVEAGVDIWMESDGCPGAEIKDVSAWITVPNELVKKPTQTAFDKWVKEFNQKRFEEGRKEALDTIKQLQTKYKIGESE